MRARKTNISFLPLVVPGILIVALVAGLVLVERRAELRRGAYYAQTKLTLQPETIQKTVGENFSVALFVDTPAKVTFTKGTICFEESKINLNYAGDLTGAIVVNEEAFRDLLLAKLVDKGGKKCLMMALKASDSVGFQLKSGVFQAVSIKFRAVAAGSGTIDISKADSQVAGMNPNGEDNSVEITEVKGTSYTITEGTGCSGSAPADICIDPTNLKVRAACVNGQWDYDEQLCNLAGRSEVCGGVNYCCPSVGGNWTTDMTACGTTPTATPTPTNTPVPTATPTPIVSNGDSVLNYKILFGGLQSDARCVTNWPVTVTVLAGGVAKSYTHTQGTLVLTGFKAREGVAVFIKGPKHLQMKYGKNDQTGVYGKAGGEITMTDSVETSPWYNFSGYPIIAGDVTGVGSEVPDGWINGVDFSYVKQRALTHETVAEGGYLQADLDGNCQVNSNDVNVLKISLNEKQGELY